MRDSISAHVDWPACSTHPAEHDRTIAQRIGRLWGRLSAMRVVARQRLDLTRLDDRTLMDIGVSRADVEREANRAFWDIDPRVE